MPNNLKLCQPPLSLYPIVAAAVARSLKLSRRQLQCGTPVNAKAMMRLRLLILVFLVGMLIATPATGQTKNKHGSPLTANETQEIRQATELSNSARELRKQAKYTLAVQQIQKALEIEERILGPAHRSTASTIRLLAELYESQGSYAQAIPLYQRSLKIREKVYGKESASYATSLSDLAWIYEAMDSFELAEPLHLEAIKIQEKVLGKENASYADSLCRLAFLYKVMGAYELAEPRYLEAIKIQERVLGKEHGSYAISLSGLAGLYELMGAYERAEPLYLEAIKIQEKVHGKENGLYSQDLVGLANLYRAMGSYKLAESRFVEVIKINEKVYGKEHPEYATSLVGLGLLYKRMGKYELAEPLYLEAKNIYERVFGKEHSSYAVSVGNLAVLYWTMGSYDRAEPLYIEGIKIMEKVLGKEHPFYATSLSNLGRFLASQGRYSDSVLWLDRARKATASHITKVLPSLSAKRRHVFLKEKFYWKLRFALSVAYQSRSSSRSATLSAGWLLNSKAIVHQTSAESALLSTPEATGLVQRLRTVRKQLAEFAINAAEGTTQETRAKLVELENREREINKELAAFRLIDTDTPWINIGTVQSNLPIGSVLINIARFEPRNIKEDKNLDPIYAAWIIPASGEGDVKLIDLGDAKKIEKQVAALRKQLNASIAGDINQTGEESLEKEFIRQSKLISKLVFAPLEDHLTGIEEILVSPDGELWTIPWETLQTADDKYVLEKYRIRYLTSGRELASNQRKGRYSGDPVVMADPDYDLSPVKIKKVNDSNKQILRSAATATFTRLPSSRTEASAIKAPLEGYTGSTAQMLLGAEAQESAFKQLHRPRSLVLSTHGYFDKYKAKKAGDIDVNPLLRCGLALAGANNRKKAMEDGKEDGILTGLEIVGTDLRGTELVVLSACETGLGEVTSGEGVAGLRQAFQLAGAQSVVSSLWQVEDGETARLMKLFFQNLASGKSKSEALRLSLIHI